jgi:hypothetical protein
MRTARSSLQSALLVGLRRQALTWGPYYLLPALPLSLLAAVGDGGSNRLSVPIQSNAGLLARRLRISIRTASWPPILFGAVS